jgi:hypothetical protein
MKKLVLVLAVMFMTAPVIAQGLDYDSWEIVESVDDFGDKTGEKVARYFSKGNFSNSATSGEDMILKLVDYGIDKEGKGFASLDFFEYNQTKANLALRTEEGSFKVKLPDGSVKSFNCYASKNGGLFFSGGDYDEFIKLINNGKSEKIKIVVNESSFSEYGNAKYQGHFHTKSASQIQ